MTSRALSVVGVLALVLHVSSGIEFEWSTVEAGNCAANDTLIGQCSKPRDVLCLNKENGQAVPEYYCRQDGLTSSKPGSEVACNVTECTRPRCVVSGWSSWKPCDPACVVSFKYRTRSILWREAPQDTCPDLLEKEDCAHCSTNSGQDAYLWMVSKWGTCRHFATVDWYQGPGASASTNARLCGPAMQLGKATRKVRCVDAKGLEMKMRDCLNSKDKYGRITQRPVKVKACQLPCDCHLSKWSTWSGCGQGCLTTVESRTRMIRYPAQAGGKPCGRLAETRACKAAARCSSFKWYGTPWGECRPVTNAVVSRNQTYCGEGYQERSHVFCSSGGGNVSDIQPVDKRLCDPNMKMASRRPCQIPCRINCKVSDWQPWTPCSVSCGDFGTKTRQRTVIEANANGGTECPRLMETSPCGKPDCYAWSFSVWSVCFNTRRCGTQSWKGRLVYCTGPTGIGNKLMCANLTKPTSRMNCTSLCPDDCALSTWSDWGPCSKSCGTSGGTQTRYRRILAYPGPTSKTQCPPADQLVETQRCNQNTFCPADSVLFYKPTVWGSCIPMASGTCGVAKGMMIRSITCSSETSLAKNQRSCQGMPTPQVSKKCDIPCKQDCALSHWQAWSQCNTTCGPQGTQTRKRFVLRYGTHGGKPCPKGIGRGNEDEQIESRACGGPCYTYEWLPSQWSDCKLLPQMKTTEKCGSGYQTRTISCVRSGDQPMNATLSMCYQHLLTPPPSTLKACSEPCAESCVRSDWSDWTTCSTETCAAGGGPVFRQRVRTVVNLSPARGGFAATCPQLKPTDFAEREQCPVIPCYTYKWKTGTWQSCIQDESSDCTRGTQQRNVFCQRSDDMLVLDSFCSSGTAKPVSKQPCALICDVDCVTSAWQPWTACAEPCGESMQIRHRGIIQQPSGLGRTCPSLTQKRLCRKTRCSAYNWSAGLWGTCKPRNGSSCGNGFQKRDVVCQPDATMEAVCLKQAAKPETERACELPCPGDCVLSNWALWSDCVNGWAGCTQTRWRSVVRSPSSAKPKCSNVTQETQPCDCPSAGNLSVSQWTSCSINKTQGTMCGTGSQYRAIKCVGKQGEILQDIKCSKPNTMATIRACSLECPVDCLLSTWSDWTMCSKECSVNRSMVRTRKVLVVGIYGGRKCPDASRLVQKKPCNEGPCVSYQLDEGVWSKCQVDGSGCGEGMRTKEIRCLRNDGANVGLHHCLGNMNRNTELEKLEILQVVLNNISQMSVSMRQSCVDPCPGNCVVSDWSEWSECGRTCFEQNGQSSQSRSRVIISKAATGGRACPSSLSETKTCQLVGDKCIGVEWMVGPWQQNDERDVWCETSSGVRVSDACITKDRPPASKSCDPTCSDANSVCDVGRCICKPGFELFQDKCVPTNGCLEDHHCVLMHTACKNQQCQCKNGYVQNSTTGTCVVSDISPGTTTTNEVVEPSSVPTREKVETGVPEGGSTTASGVTTTTNDDTDKKALSDEPVSQDYVKWIGISVGVLLFCILLVIGVFCYTRRQRSNKKQQYSAEKGNSIELIGMQSIGRDGNVLPAKV